jgi:hypothetical protein
MTGYYSLLDKIKNHFTNDPLINTITQGSIFNVDLGKQNIFPLVHVMVNNVNFNDNVISAANEKKNQQLSLKLQITK